MNHKQLPRHRGRTQARRRGIHVAAFTGPVPRKIRNTDNASAGTTIARRSKETQHCQAGQSAQR